MDEINIDDLMNMAGDNVYDTEYSHKLTISCKYTTYKMFIDLKKKFNTAGINLNNAQLFECMVIELYNTNLDSYQ